MLTLVVMAFIPLILKLFYVSVEKYWWNMTWVMALMGGFSTSFFYSSLGLCNFTVFFQVDIMSSILISLSCWISGLMMMSSTKIYFNKNKLNLFSSLVFLLNFMIIMVFMQSNVMSLYIFFEGSLIPTLALILIWGYQPERLQAGMYMMIYTVTASLPLLINIMMLFMTNGHLNMNLSIFINLLSGSILEACWWLILLAAFLVKLPLFMVHLWLPKAHVEAPVAGSMILAALLLKLGGYGIMRFLFLVPKLGLLLNTFIMVVALIGSVITSLICIRQTDIKSLIAYSSIGHMGIMVGGMMTNTFWGLNLGLIMMLAHGLSSSALFCLANMLYEKSNSRNMFISKGFLSIMPSLALWWFLLCALNMAAPPSINLVSELGLIVSVLAYSILFAVTLVMMGFLSAVYSLILYTSTQHGGIPVFMNGFATNNSIVYVLLFLHWIPAQMLILVISKFLFF